MSNLTACGSKNPTIDYVNEFQKLSQVSHIIFLVVLDHFS
jgi:hypothetical protein